MSSLLSTKQKLLNLCRDFVQERIASAEQAIHLAQASANEETKSSSGDKFETGRAMAQLEIENNSKQLAEANKLKQTLDHIQIEQSGNQVQLGSLVYTDNGNYFIAISAGKLNIAGSSFYAVSPASPVGMKLMKLTPGSSFSLNDQQISVNSIA